MNLGYACINMTLSGQKPKVTTNRSMIKTFNEKGISYAGELGMLNAADLGRILRYQRMESNVLVIIEFFRGHPNTDLKIYHNILELKHY